MRLRATSRRNRFGPTSGPATHATSRIPNGAPGRHLPARQVGELENHDTEEGRWSLAGTTGVP